MENSFPNKNEVVNGLLSYLRSRTGSKCSREFVYILWDKSNLPDWKNTRVKIGRSSNPARRAMNLRSQSGNDKLVLFMVFKTKDAEAEKNVHTLFGDHRTIGEWFNLSPFVAMNKIITTPNFFHKNFESIQFSEETWNTNAVKEFMLQITE